jgi:hypothetical protein
MDGACQPFLHDRHFSAASSFQIGIGRGSADILCRAPVTHAQTELVGKAVILTDGKTGTVESVWLDEMHGLRGSIRGHDGKWPVSTIKFAQTGRHGSTTK